MKKIFTFTALTLFAANVFANSNYHKDDQQNTSKGSAAVWSDQTSNKTNNSDNKQQVSKSINKSTNSSDDSKSLDKDYDNNYHSGGNDGEITKDNDGNTTTSKTENINLEKGKIIIK